VTGGGTGGHIYPALATIDKIKELEPNSEFLYIGVKGKMECQIVPDHGVNFKSIVISGIDRKNILKNFKTFVLFFSAYRSVKKIIKDFKPDVAFGTGGYVTGPVLFAAHKSKVPTVLLEQDAALGLANKFLSKKVNTICYVFESGVESIKDLNIVKTGNPASEAILKPKNIDSGIRGLKKGMKKVLITGGSLGAAVFEKIVTEKSEDEINYQIIYATGRKNYEKFIGNNKIENKNIIVVPYIDNMAGLLQDIDLIIGRAGATSITENLALGMPSIIIPYPHAGNNEQLFNAQQIEKQGGCICVEEKDVNTKMLFEKVENLLFDEIKYESMKKSALKLGIQDSATRVYQQLSKVARRG